MADPTRVQIGRVVRAHGIRGEVVIETDADSTALADAESCWLGEQAFVIEDVRDTPRGWLVALEGVATRNDAELLARKPVFVARELIANDGEPLLEDLIGHEVRLVAGGSWGRIVGVESGGQDRLVIHGDRERLLPAVKELIVRIDPDLREVWIDPPGEWPSEPLPESA